MLVHEAPHVLRLTPLSVSRCVASPAALDSIGPAGDLLVLRTAPDEALIVTRTHWDGGTIDVQWNPASTDDHAITIADTSLHGAWMPIAPALDALQYACDWELPAARPAFVQGAVAGLPVKIWFEHDRVLFIVAAPFAADFEERINAHRGVR